MIFWKINSVFYNYDRKIVEEQEGAQETPSTSLKNCILKNKLIIAKTFNFYLIYLNECSNNMTAETYTIREK